MDVTHKQRVVEALSKNETDFALVSVLLNDVPLESIDHMDNELRSIAKDICKKYDVKLEINQIGGFDPVSFDKECLNHIRNSAKKFGYSFKDIISGAGHDACWINTVAPSAMIMCPCVDGLSHNEAEEIKPEWAASSTNVLLHAAIAAAN